MAWDTEILNKAEKTTQKTSSPKTLATPTVQVLQDERSSTGVSESAQRSDRITPNVGYDVIVQDEDTLSQGDRDAGPDGIIRTVQKKLNDLGLDVGDVDGVIGRKTSGTIQEAQGMLGLPRTGVLDKKTRLGLITLSPNQINFLKNNPKSEAGYQNLGENVPVTTVKENVVEIEDTPVDIKATVDKTTPVDKTTETIPSTNANTLTFRSEAVSSPTNVRSIQSLIGVSVDGDWGPQSEAALKSFQKKNGLSPTGNWQDPQLVSWVKENVPVDLTDRSTTDPYRVPTLSDDNITTLSTEDWVGEGRDKGASSLFGREVQGKEFTGTVSKINMGGEVREIIDVSDKIVGQVGGGNTMVPRVLVLHETDAVDKSSGKRIEYNGLGHFLNARKNITTQWFVDQDGRIFKITPNTRVGNHASGMHRGSLGIEVEGLSEEGGTPEAATEAAAWLSEYLVRTNPEITHVVSHHQIGRGIGLGKDDGATQLEATLQRLGLPPLKEGGNVVLHKDFKQLARGK